jgi:hypothetical protein
MGIIDKLFGGDSEPEPQPTQGSQREPARTDEQAIARYRYLLKTAPPEAIEQAHAEAFAQLSPEQRRRVLEQLRSDVPEFEQNAATSNGDDPRSLARMATRAEMRRPGTLERAFGSLGGGQIGVGGLLAGSFMSSLAGTVIGSMVAQQFFAHDEQHQVLAEGPNDYSPDDTGDDFGGGDFDSGDFEV